MKLLFAVIVASVLTGFTLQNDKPAEAFNHKALEKSLKLIPATNLSLGFPDYESTYPISLALDNRFQPMTTQTAQVAAFYISDHEVTNREYRFFLEQLHQKDVNLYTKMLPDTTSGWSGQLSGFGGDYFRGSQFEDYPVVGISHEQAAYYCEWLTEKYMASPKRKYKNVIFKLPTIAQWSSAAYGETNRLPCESKTLLDRKGKPVLNFKVIDQANITTVNLPNGRNTTSAHICPVSDKMSFDASSGIANGVKATNMSAAVSFAPNLYKLYNMGGNAKEYVAEKGFVIGGSCNDPGFSLRKGVIENYNSPDITAIDRGFRIVMEIAQ
jgi:formylglycine-generating enzyme required for sulfatase activity